MRGRPALSQGNYNKEIEPTLESVLHRQVMPFIELVDSLSLESLTTRYSFVDDGEFLELLTRDVNEGTRVYWIEMLSRAHIAAVTGILRSRHWVSAILSAYSEQNALGFAAAFRALMESAADTSDGLRSTPPTLAHLHHEISEALAGRTTVMFGSKELEDDLIHYTHARFLKPDERDSLPRSHKALRPSALKDLKELGNTDKVTAAYRFLSDLTHPAAASVWIWLSQVGGTGLEFTLSPKQGEAVISAFLEVYETVLLDVLMLAFNTPVVVLDTLNQFPIREFHTPALLDADLGVLAAWRESLSEMEAARGQEGWSRTHPQRS